MRATWARVLDTRKLTGRERREESYWPFAITGETFRAIVLKGLQQHPPFPVPYPQEFPLRLPFRKKLDQDDEAALEEQYARKAMFLDIKRDALADELTNTEIARAEAALDTELIKLIQKACSNTSARPTRQARALDLTRMLHHTTLVEKAVQIAQFYRLRGLEDQMKRIHEEKDDEQRLTDARERRREWASDLDAIPPPPGQRPTNERDAAQPWPRPFEDFNPPPAVHRPGLARAVPGGTSNLPSDPTPAAFPEESVASGLPVDGKRKRLPDEDFEPVMADDSLASKRRALQEVMGTSKPSTHTLHALFKSV